MFFKGITFLQLSAVSTELFLTFNFYYFYDFFGVDLTVIDVLCVQFD